MIRPDGKMKPEVDGGCGSGSGIVKP